MLFLFALFAVVRSGKKSPVFYLFTSKLRNIGIFYYFLSGHPKTCANHAISMFHYNCFIQFVRQSASHDHQTYKRNKMQLIASQRLFEWEIDEKWNFEFVGGRFSVCVCESWNWDIIRNAYFIVANVGWAGESNKHSLNEGFPHYLCLSIRIFCGFFNATFCTLYAQHHISCRLLFIYHTIRNNGPYKPRHTHTHTQHTDHSH